MTCAEKGGRSLRDTRTTVLYRERDDVVLYFRAATSVGTNSLLQQIGKIHYLKARPPNPQTVNV